MKREAREHLRHTTRQRNMSVAASAVSQCPACFVVAVPCVLMATCGTRFLAWRMQHAQDRLRCVPPGAQQVLSTSKASKASNLVLVKQVKQSLVAWMSVGDDAPAAAKTSSILYIAASSESVCTGCVCSFLS
jgi:hypothetical protein